MGIDVATKIFILNLSEN